MQQKKILEGLNARQREAVETIDGPLLIVAGPGSGKTRVITHRIAYLVKVIGVPPYRIAAVTFTNKAAKEMKERLHELLGPSVRDMTASTFHAFCAMLLRREGEQIGLSREFTIYDDSDQQALFKRCMSETNVDPKRFPIRGIQSAISGAKSQLINAEQFGKGNANYWDEIVHRVYERYELLMARNSALDFDDLLFKVSNMLRDRPDIATKYQERYSHLMVDEFQDTNVAQYEIAKQIGDRTRNVCVVGDPDQSIYSWRNADIRNILSFQKDFPEAKSIALEENYRSTQTIVDAAMKLISSNAQRVDKELFTQNGKGVPIVTVEGYNEQEEAQYVVKEMERLVKTEGYSRGEVAVMYRVNAQSRALEEVCMRHGIPYQLVGNLRFYQRQEIKDVAAYLKLLVNPDDDVSLGRVVNVPPRGIGQRTLDELTRTARDAGISMFAAIETLSNTGEVSPDAVIAPLPARSVRALTNFRELIQGLVEDRSKLDLVDLIDLVLERTGYGRHVQDEEERGEERWENIQEFKSGASAFIKDFEEVDRDDTLAAFLESVTLVSDTDNMEDRANAVTLITLHQAKGLEFRVVFMVGMEDGILPHSRSMDDEEQMEEERRLCYVGMTRAKERLYLTRAYRRGFRGGFEPSGPSQFLDDIPKDLIVTRSATRVGSAETGAWPSGPSRSTSPGKQVQPSRAGNGKAQEAPQVVRRRAGSSGPPKPQAAPLKTGDKIRHPKFGEGMVMGTKLSGTDTEVTVAFSGGQGVKRLLLSFAPLEKVD
jgi:DNA helicase II / ATP-dependent DNA helicase PcrA